MNTTLAPGASLRRVGEIVRNALLFGPGAWDGGSSPRPDAALNRGGSLVPTDRDVTELFALLQQRNIAYVLVGGIAMLRYVEGRNTADIDLLMSLPAVRSLPELTIQERNEKFVQARFRGVSVDVLVTANPLFRHVAEKCAILHRFAEMEVPTATPEGLILLKLYALPSLYRQGLFDRVSIYEGDIASLLQRGRIQIEPFLRTLQDHLSEPDLRELRAITRDIQERIARFERFEKAGGEASRQD